MREFDAEEKPKLRLVAFGDPVLDALYARSQEKVARRGRVKQPEPAKCPGCDRVALLVKHNYATLCEECHASICDLARNPRW